jgi:hypothetical protein
MPGESSMFQEELQEAKQQTTELQAAAMPNGTSRESRQIWPQVEQIETQKRLEKELLRWKLIHKGWEKHILARCRAKINVVCFVHHVVTELLYQLVPMILTLTSSDS